MKMLAATTPLKLFYCPKKSDRLEQERGL